MISINFHTSEDQLLTAKLYNTSKNPAIKRRRLFSWLMIPLLYGILGYIFWSIKGGKMIYFFISFSVLWILLYPFWEGNRFKRSYQKGLAKTANKLLNIPVNIQFSNEIYIQTGEKTETYSYHDLQSLVQIKNYNLLLFNNERTIAIPNEYVDNNLLQWLKDKNVLIENQLNWKWK